MISDDIDERGDTLLELWPLLLVLAGAMALVNLVRSRHNLDLRALLPFVLLIAVNGTMMSQQLWGSTYAIWPLLILLLAEMFVRSSMVHESRRQQALDGFRMRLPR